MRLRIAVATVLVAIAVAVVPSTTAHARVVVPTRAADVVTTVRGLATVRLPFAAHHVALHWHGHPDARVAVNGNDVGRDEVGEQRNNGETYGAVQQVDNASVVTLTTDRALRLTVVAMADGARRVVHERQSATAYADDSVGQPGIVSRAGWGADERKRTWNPSFAPITRMFVHHTVTANDDGTPAATIRSIYHYHAVTQGWGDIGYNYLVDAQGRIYEGRYSRVGVTGEDGARRGVIGAHTKGYNTGAVGVALLGNFTSRDATAAAKAGLADLLAWKADRHNIDPYSLRGHRDVGDTSCPGGAFYAGLGGVRDAINQRIVAARDRVPPTVPQGLSASTGITEVELQWQPSTDDGGSGLAGYEVLRADRADGPFTVIAAAGATSWTDGNLAHLSTHWYHVRAFDGRGNRSAASGAASALAL